MKTYTTFINRIPDIINNSQGTNIVWATEVINDKLRYLTTKYYFNERTYQTTTQAQTQFYNLPPQIKRVINVTITIGGVVWQPKECPSRQLWDQLNIVTFYQDFPSYFFVYNGQLGIFPIPSSTGNAIKVNYKIRTTDLSTADVTNATASATITTPYEINASNAIPGGSTTLVLGKAFPFSSGNYQVVFSSGDTKTSTFTSGSTFGLWSGTLPSGSATANMTLRTAQGADYVSVAGGGTTVFYNWMQNNWLRIPYNSTNNLASGDNQWYQIAQVNSGTTLTLMSPYGSTSAGTTNFAGSQYAAVSAGTANFTIGEVPILPEDYQDLPLYGMGVVYYTTRFPDASKAQLYQGLWDSGVKALDEEFGSKTTSVELTEIDVPSINPNLYIKSISQN